MSGLNQGIFNLLFSFKRPKPDIQYLKGPGPVSKNEQNNWKMMLQSENTIRLLHTQISLKNFVYFILLSAILMTNHCQKKKSNFFSQKPPTK